VNRIKKKKYKEIAEQLNISAKAAEKRMHTPLKIVKERIHLKGKVSKYSHKIFIFNCSLL
jgi:DNA-directed RNA polymerase specialized sigma24 family protein